jgi:uncharacterized protein (DUF433 family)
MTILIESKPGLCGGKPVIKGTRIPVEIIFEMVELNYSITEIVHYYPTLTEDVVEKVIAIGKKAQKHLSKIDWAKYTLEETSLE